MQRRCGTMAAHMRLLEAYAPFRARQARIERSTARRRSALAAAAKPPLVTVDVVVNVVYRTSDQNVSDAQVKSQVAVLNRDLAAKNPDRKKVPEPWKGLVTDLRVRFKLAKVTRTKTTRSSFSTDDSVKRASGGGTPPFAPATHLNLWVCSLSGGVLGYAQFPGGPAAVAHRTLFVSLWAPLGRPLSTDGIRHAIGRAFARCGIEAAGPHILRRSWATLTHRQGTGLKLIADILGHQSLETTAPYAQVHFEELRQAALPWPRIKL